jgi:protein-arginine deiminase
VAPAPDVTPQPVVDIRADVNRDGEVSLDDPTEDQDEDSWDKDHGAIFLANIDDDDKSCPRPKSMISDAELARCHDAADDEIDGPDDLKDLAVLKTVPWPDAPDDASGAVKLAAPGNPTADGWVLVRLFRRDGASHKALETDHAFTAAELRKGVDLWLEGRDLVRNVKVWDGYLDVTLEVTFTEGGKKRTLSDTVRMRMAPMLTSHHLQPIKMLFVTGTSDPDSVKFRDDLAKAATAAGVPKTRNIGTTDQWTQDFFETGWMSMPAKGGKQHVIAVYFRSANLDAPGHPISPLRYAGRVVYDVRGPDVAALQQYDAKHPQDMDTLNSFGNLETIPPYTHGGESYLMGRIIRGSTRDFYPDPSVTRLLEAQKIQAPLAVDTSWLLVGHVDETLSFVKATSGERGWLLALNDPELAVKMLEDASKAGHGDATMFEGKYWIQGWGKLVSAQTTVDKVLADTEVMAESAKAAVEIKAQLATLKKETGITDAEIISVPFLHHGTDGYSAAYQPGTINGTVLADGHFAAPDPHGPVVGGVDIFKEQMTNAFAKHGVTVHFVEDWDLYHRLGGEVHCGTNAERVAPNTKWWEAGR